MIELFEKALKELGYENEVKISASKAADYQFDGCFKLAKLYHKAPFQIASEVINKIKEDARYDDYFKNLEVAGPGFINITVSDKYISGEIRQLINSDSLTSKEEGLYVLDYGGPNVAKPLHVGHLRSAIIGQSINNILKYKGYKTVSDVHLGDFGLQIGQVIYGILKDNPGVDIKDIDFDLAYLNETYPKISGLCKENEEVKNECALITKKLQDGDPDYKILWQKIMEISIQDIKRIYRYLSVDFDLWYGESDAYKYYGRLFKMLEDYIIVDKGAKIIEVKEDDDKIDIPPCIVEKSDGAFLYATSDLGTILQRKEDYHPDGIIYIADERQSMHFTQVFRAAKKAHIYEGKFEHHGFGTVNGKDNKPFKTRSGGALKLEGLIEEVRENFINLREENKDMPKEDLDKIINAILKFADLQNNMERNYIFDIKKFCEVNGKTGPYILYTYLRINKIIDECYELSDTVYNEYDKALRLKLLEVSNVIDLAAKERRPHYIADYLYELAVLSNNFYQNNRMSDIEGKQKEDFNALLTFNNRVIKELLGLLGIDIPSAM